MESVLVSACLMGRPVRFDGAAKPVVGLTGDGDDHAPGAILARWRSEGRAVVYCPEVGGGLGVPRPPAEIENAAGARAVLDGTARIVTPQGVDVTRAYLAGAHAALETARSAGVRVAVVKESSPSCGLRQVYDGTFAGKTVSGPGVTTRLLLDHGIAVYTERDIPAAQAHLTALEQGGP
ncbi:DUF523 domain-containing protein [Lipingzhangella sp. LS1_29]|uniref:DUF523 domain-containing protein n=1 Tax=Lipingzhangella rawalii TaxID=2055835 RepID=A0ABU2H1Y1_9ACTN|nr:DUF523 domain-containing protein [Lipingzhangella rawalii]MDS1269308.1 DUF523 domain-containing protein [Lipingzhangella rawalii]